MFVPKSRIFQKNEVWRKSISGSSLKLFSQQAQNFSSGVVIDKNFLYPFSQSQTSKALTLKTASAGTSKLNFGRIVLLDKLGGTDYSETYRAYNLDSHTFVAQKNIHLYSPASWIQTNLILRQQQQSSPSLAQTLSIDYDEEKLNLKVISEFQNTIFKDYSVFMKDHWLQERMKVYTMQIIQQLSMLKQLGIELDGKTIDPKKIFIDKSLQMLKLYDLSDFIIKDTTTTSSACDQREFLEIAKQTLISLSPESIGRDKISLIFDEIEAEMHNYGRDIKFSQEEDFHKVPGSYDQFIFDKLLRVLKENEASNLKGADLMRDLKMVYKKHAEIHKTKGDFKSALECYEKIMEIEENSGQIRELMQSQSMKADLTKESAPTTETYIPTSLSGKLAVMVIKATLFISVFMIAFIFFGLITAICFYGYFHLINTVLSDAKQEEIESKN